MEATPKAGPDVASRVGMHRFAARGTRVGHNAVRAQ
jgi:hypothetical protein